METRLCLRLWLCFGLAGCTGAVTLPGQALPSGNGSTPGNPSPMPGTDDAKRTCRSPAPRIWHLTPVQYARTLQQLAPGVAIPSVRNLEQSTPKLGGVFSNQASANVLSEPYVSELYSVANEWARAASRSPEKLASCASASISQACASTLFRNVLQKSQRHPVDDVTVQRTVDFYQTQRAAEPQEKALEMALLTVALSPDMLFRTELGNGQPEAPLDPFETASAIAYTLTDAPPDDELLAAAEKNQLQAREGIESQARRLVSKPDIAVGAKRFLDEHFELNKIATARKDAAVFAEWTDEVASDLALSTARFVEDAVWNQGGTMKTLLTSSKAFANARTAPFHNLTLTSADLTAVTLPPERRGLLTLPGILASHAHPNRSSIVFRGKFILERMLCQKLTPPAQVPPIPQVRPGLTTQRERLASITGSAGCASCHASLNEMGFPFERFDGVGKTRDTDEGAPVVTTGTLMATPAVAVADAPGFAQALADSSLAEQCLAQQAVTFVYGHASETDNDGCAEREVGAAMAANGASVLEALVKSLAAPTFSVRKTP
jgi:Protein of unknown function (DUF1592)/Protein of unknown function (DUF1588)